MSTTIAFVHLLLRASAVNHNFYAPWRYARAIGLLLITVNAAIQIAVVIDREYHPVLRANGEWRCRADFGHETIQLKYIIQLLCHIVFASFFVYPLLSHMRAMKATASDSTTVRANMALYRQLVTRACLAMTVAVSFTGEFSTFALHCISVYDRTYLSIPRAVLLCTHILTVLFNSSN
jgi:hypothetical protein